MRREKKLLIGVLTLLFVIDWSGTQLPDFNPEDCDPTKFACDKNEGNRNDLSNQNRPESGQLQFFMDSSADCNTQVRETGERDIVVYGRGGTQVGASPLTCVLSLRVDRPRDPQRYKISLRDMDIRDCDVQFYIYDGTMSQTLLGRYNCPANSDTNYDRVLYSSGNMVTFNMRRRSRENKDYSIQLSIATIPTNNPAGPNDPNVGNDYNRYYKFEQKYIVLIVGLGYGLATGIVVLILLICAYCVNRDAKSWQKSRFGYVNPTMNGNKSTLNGSNAWSTLKPLNYGPQSTRASQRNSSVRKTPVNVKKRMIDAGEDGDSVFESDGTFPQKRPLASQDQYGRPYQHDRYGPPAPREQSERQAYRRPPPSNLPRKVDTDDSYVQADDDHPQSTFVEKVITIPAKKSKKPPPEEEDEFTSEEEEEVSDSSADEEVEKMSSTMNTDPDTTERGTTQDDGPSSGDERVSVQYAKPNKLRASPEVVRPVAQAAVPQPPRPRTPPMSELEAYTEEPRTMGTPDSHGSRPLQQNPAAPGYQQYPAAPGYQQYPAAPGYQSDHRAGYNPPPEMPYSSYASDAPPRPTQPGQRNFYPDMAPPSYQTNERYPRYNTPDPHYPSSYEDNAYQPLSRAGRRDPQGYRDPYRGPNQAPPQDPPIYSYLVQRGYKPVDIGRRSPGSSNDTNNSLENRIEETNLSANLGSGVEVMRR